MDLFGSIIEKQTLMMEAYKDFRDLCDQLREEHARGDEPWLAPAKEESPLEDLNELRTGQEEEFDIPQSFSFRDINPDDPAFATGKSIGIPVGLLVRTDDNQGHLLPIVNGRFRSDVI